MMATGQMERAIVAFDRAIEQDIERPKAHVLRGRVLLLKGDLDDAMVDFDRALTLNPKFAEGLSARGLGWFRKREYSKALADLDRAIELQAHLDAYYTRAQVHEAQGNADRAIADFRRATQLTPQSAFDALAQTDAKKRIEQLSKRVPCGGAGSGGDNPTCL
jgi:tetratricopeptide (TPR) repeat protein